MYALPLLLFVVSHPIDEQDETAKPPWTLSAAVRAFTEKSIATKTQGEDDSFKEYEVTLGLHLIPIAKGKEMVGRCWILTTRTSKDEFLYTIYRGDYAFGFDYGGNIAISCRLDSVFTTTDRVSSKRKWKTENPREPLPELKLAIASTQDGRAAIMPRIMVGSKYLLQLEFSGITVKTYFPVTIGRLPTSGLPEPYAEELRTRKRDP